MKNYSLPDYSKIKDDLRPMPADADVVKEYESGFIGAYHDPAGDELAEESVRNDGMPFLFSDIASAYRYAGQAKSGVYLLYKEIEACGMPLETIPYVSQPCGNCVSRGTQNAIYHTLCAAVNSGEGSLPPEAFAAAKVKCNPVASEPWYWFKWPGTRPGGDGWHASACLAAAKDKTGLVWRGDYSHIGGPDLTIEKRSTAHAYAAKSVPEKFLEYSRKHPLLTYARCDSFEEVADAISAGYAVQTDGGEGWSKSLDEHGYARRTTRWSHSMCVTAVVTTQEAKAKYNTAGLLLIQNSWGKYLKNDHCRVIGTNEGIPPGSFFAKWEDCTRRSFYAVSSVKGWPNRKLRSWDVSDLI